MATALTIFGVGRRGAHATFCYACFRTVRGAGEYPPATRSGEAQPRKPTRVPLETVAELELVIWDQILDDAAINAMRDELASGRFSIPRDCPIETGRVLSGQACEPIIILEDNIRVRSSGTGVLRAKSLIPHDGIEVLIQRLRDAVGPDDTPRALTKLIAAISHQSGLGTIFKERCRLGIVDWFYRYKDDPALYEPMFSIVPERYEPRNPQPLRRCHLRREGSFLPTPLRLHITLKNYDEVIRDYLVEMPPGDSEHILEANSHITDVAVTAFDQAADTIEHVSGVFSQGIDFGIVVRGGADELPEPFRGAPESIDLQKRPRIHTAAFKGPSIHDLSGGFDAIRRVRGRIATLSGEPRWSGENLWFERGGEGQLAVIRWIKAKLETPGLRHAYLIDPFLGSDALQRVIARQGNENIALTILVSPGRIDPDADAENAEAKKNHLEKLTATAREWSDRLCGQITILHIKRGDGTRQAFHDRFLCTVDQHGVPRVYLLSNSLSKAAGDWPFALCELDRILSWRVNAYIQNLSSGSDRDRELQALPVWKSPPPDASYGGLSRTIGEPTLNDDRPEWARAVDTLLHALWSAVTRTSTPGEDIDAAVDAFNAHWPRGLDTEVLADNLFRIVNHRDEHVVRVASRFARGSKEQRDVARRLNESLLDQFISSLPRDGDVSTFSWMLSNSRNEFLTHIGSVIAARLLPTNLVRAQINPVLDGLVQLIENQRLGTAFDALHIATCLISVGLEVAVASESAERQYRNGMATDYVHWAGRLMRSTIAAIRYDRESLGIDPWMDDIAFCARQILKAKEVLGESLQPAVGRVFDDELVLPVFKEMLTAKEPKVANPEGSQPAPPELIERVLRNLT